MRSINIMNGHGFFTQIFPLSFACDVSAAKLRKYILENHAILSLEAFPERDNEKKRVFENVKMSVCILNLLKRKKDDNFFVRIHDDRFVDIHNEKIFLNNTIIQAIDRNNCSIPLLSSNDLQIVHKVFNSSNSLDFYGHCYTGEIDLTLNKKYLSDNPKKSTLLKGAMIDRYLIRGKMSQGEIKYLDSAAYLRDNSGSKATHYKTERIVMQAITGVNEKIRLKMTIAEKGLFCANSVNYIIFNGEINLNYMLALLNSSLLNFIFSKTSTNSNVNGYEIDNLPIIIPDVKRQQSFIPLVEHIFAITTDEDYFQNPTIQAQVKALEQKIDQLVYKLYGLTEDEIRIVEGRNLSR